MLGCVNKWLRPFCFQLGEGRLAPPSAGVPLTGGQSPWKVLVWGCPCPEPPQPEPSGPAPRPAGSEPAGGHKYVVTVSHHGACWPPFPQRDVYGHWGPCQALRAEGMEVSCCGGGWAPSSGYLLSPGERPAELGPGLGGCWPQGVVCSQDAELCGAPSRGRASGRLGML